MQRLIAILFLSIFLLVPAHADDDSLWDGIKDEISDDDRPGQHGRDNAAKKQRENPGKGSKGDDKDDTLWDKMSDEEDGDGKKNNHKNSQHKKNKKK
jgi:hypothetical protein